MNPSRSPEIAYLAAPYSSSLPTKELRDLEVEQRMMEFCVIDAFLTAAHGIYTVSPLSKHFTLKHQKIPGDWDFWGHYGELLLSRCDYMIVIMFKGWKESVGVQAEIKIAERLNKTVRFFDPNGMEFVN